MTERADGAASALAAPDAWPAEGGPPGGAPLATVVVVNFNGGAEIRTCLASLRDDPFTRGRSEIVVVDNASTDGSADGLEAAFPGIRLMRSPENLGFGAANNLGARAARGRYLAFLNPDALATRGWLEALLAALESEPGAGLATSRILLQSDPGRVNTCGNEVHYTGLTLCRGLGRPSDEFPALEEVTAISGAAFAIDSALFAELGGFDEEFFLYMEDTDLSWRARLNGRTCLYVPSSVVYHNWSLSFGPLKTFYQERNRYLLLLRGLRRRSLLALAPALLLAEAVTWGFSLARDRGRLGNKLRAYAWIARHWPAIVAGRRRVQALRRVRDRELIAPCASRLAYEQTGTGLAATVARVVFDPLFQAWHRVSLALMGW